MYRSIPFLFQCGLISFVFALIFLCFYSPKLRPAISKAVFSPCKVNYNQLETMSPPCISREPGRGRRLLWAFRDLLNYTIQLRFIRQCTAINQTAMFSSFSAGTMNLTKFILALPSGSLFSADINWELQHFQQRSRLNAPLHTVCLQVKLSVSSGSGSEF